MKISLAIAGLSLAAMSLTACGGDDSKTSAPASVASSATSSVSSAVSTPSSSSAPTTSSPVTPSPVSTSSTAPASAATSPTSRPSSTTHKPAASPSARKSTAPRATKTAPAVQVGGLCGRVSGMPVVAGSSTTCPFALNVARAGFANLNAGHPSDPVTVYSPTLGRNVTMQASYGAHGWDFTGGNGASVTVKN